MAMEKRCEFCMALRPVVFCKSDAAHLCLSCDAKVHSANALSYRHPRTLVCESCRQQPALVRCFDHQMFMCQSCDIGHHASLDHHMKILSCYVGCPSAKDLADLWGFNFEELENNFAVKDQSASSDGSVLQRESVGSKVENDDRQQKSSSYLILQQIVDLKGLQLSEGIDDSCLAHVKERPGGAPFRHDATWKEHRMLENNHLEHSEGHHDFPHRGSCVGKTEEALSSPFSQLENFTSNGNPMNGDPFWHYRSPLHNNEIWLQNMQDLGVCDEVQCFEDVNIPDVDLTFRNFEELFGGDQETSNNACSFEDQHPSFGRTEVTDDIDKEISPSYSVSLFSVSRISGESSSGSHCNDDGLSSKHVSCELVSTKSGGQDDDATMRYKEKKLSRHEKQGQYKSPKSKSDFKKRGKSQVLKVEGLEGDCGSVARF